MIEFLLFQLPHQSNADLQAAVLREFTSRPAITISANVSGVAKPRTYTLDEVAQELSKPYLTLDQKNIGAVYSNLYVKGNAIIYAMLTNDLEDLRDMGDEFSIYLKQVENFKTQVYPISLDVGARHLRIHNDTDKVIEVMADISNMSRVLSGISVNIKAIRDYDPRFRPRE